MQNARIMINEQHWEKGLPHGKSTLDLARAMAGVSGLQTRRFRYQEIDGEKKLFEIGVHMGDGVVEPVGEVEIDFNKLGQKANDSGMVVIAWKDAKTGAPQSGSFDLV